MGACAMPHIVVRDMPADGLVYANMIPHLAPEPGTKQGIMYELMSGRVMGACAITKLHARCPRSRTCQNHAPHSCGAGYWAGYHLLANVGLPHGCMRHATQCCTRYACGVVYANMIPHLAPEPGTRQGIINGVMSGRLVRDMPAGSYMPNDTLPVSSSE